MRHRGRRYTVGLRGLDDYAWWLDARGDPLAATDAQHGAVMSDAIANQAAIVRAAVAADGGARGGGAAAATAARGTAATEATPMMLTYLWSEALELVEVRCNCHVTTT